VTRPRRDGGAATPARGPPLRRGSRRCLRPSRCSAPRGSGARSWSTPRGRAPWPGESAPPSPRRAAPGVARRPRSRSTAAEGGIAGAGGGQEERQGASHLRRLYRRRATSRPSFADGVSSERSPLALSTASLAWPSRFAPDRSVMLPSLRALPEGRVPPRPDAGRCGRSVAASRLSRAFHSERAVNARTPGHAFSTDHRARGARLRPLAAWKHVSSTEDAKRRPRSRSVRGQGHHPRLPVSTPPSANIDAQSVDGGVGKPDRDRAGRSAPRPQGHAPPEALLKYLTTVRSPSKPTQRRRPR
jgi:hypothetical protein